MLTLKTYFTSVIQISNYYNNKLEIEVTL